LTSLVSFNSANGYAPHAALTLGKDGNFYGTTYHSSTSDGTLFQVSTNGTLTTLVFFSGTNGMFPEEALTLGNASDLYGTTSQGGTSCCGTIFRVATNGALTTLVSFNRDSPAGAVALGNDGNFYGVTFYGAVFKVTTSGTFTTLSSFSNRTDGAYPRAGLTRGNDGDFYGTTELGGTGDYGAVFKVATNGTLTTLVSFAKTNGAAPHAALTLGEDGNFYGTTRLGGSSDYGTVFLVTTNGALLTLVSFNGTNGAYPRGALTPGNDGSFYGTTSWGGSGNKGTVFRLLPPPVSIFVPPQSQTNNAGATVSFLVSAGSRHPLIFQWQKNGTNLIDGGNILGATTNTLTIRGISDSDAAVYSVIVSSVNGSVTNSATLTVINPPCITSHPTNLLVLSGNNATFGISVTGTAPLRLQWRFNGTNLLNATNAIYTIASAATNRAGYYSVVITNQAGGATSSSAALTVVLSPRSQTNYASSAAAFTAAAFSPESLNYQWQKNGTNLADGGNLSSTTNSTLAVANVSNADAGNYRAVVSDATGSVITSNAMLSVNDSLFIASQPKSQTCVAGGVVTFSVTVYGAPPFVFQWYFKGAPVGLPTTGTNCSSYTVINVGTNHAGSYSVQVVNGHGSLTSSIALLTVIDPPKLALQFSAGYPLLKLFGVVGKNFVVQYNSNLVDANWINLLSLTNMSASPYLFLDSAGAVEPARFYRAFMQ